MKITYNDIWIRIGGSVLAAHFIDSLGRPESFFQRLTSRYYYIDLLCGSLIAFVLWSLIRAVSIRLDKRYPWLTHPALRLMLQAALGLLVPVIFCFLLTFFFLQLVWQQDIFQSMYLYNELPVVALVLLLINFGYFTAWLYQSLRPAPVAAAAQAPEAKKPEAAPATPVQSPAKKAEYIEVPKAGKVVLLRTDDLAYAYLKGSYCYLRTHTADNFVTTYALDDLFNLLDEAQFFRANRQMIINRRSCCAYNSIEFGKIALELQPSYREPVVVSQKRARAFREWIDVTA